MLCMGVDRGGGLGGSGVQPPPRNIQNITKKFACSHFLIFQIFLLQTAKLLWLLLLLKPKYWKYSLRWPKVAVFWFLADLISCTFCFLFYWTLPPKLNPGYALDVMLSVNKPIKVARAKSMLIKVCVVPIVAKKSDKMISMHVSMLHKYSFFFTRLFL